jgi:hypothetical protein
MRKISKLLELERVRQAVAAASGSTVFKIAEVVPDYYNVQTLNGCRAAHIVDDGVEVY